MRHLSSFLLILVAACGGGDDGGATADASGGGGDGAIDAPEADGGAVIDAPMLDGAAGCGAMAPPLADLGGTEGIAIAADGTVYYSQNGAVGRWIPGGAAVDQWVTLAGATTVWGMAFGPAGVLYVGTPGGGGRIWSIDTTAATPTATTYLMNAGSANGVTVGPDGAVYYSNFNASGHVYRVAQANTRTQVTTTAINQPNGVLFDADGTLLVATYSNGDIVRLTLTAGAETARATALAGTVGMTGNPDGLARDEQGRLYVTNNSGGRVLRFGAASGGTFGAREELLANVGSAANMAFGRGALACTDLYVTSSGALRRIAAGASGVP